jgi:hypothetical protein
VFLILSTKFTIAAFNHMRMKSSMEKVESLNDRSASQERQAIDATMVARQSGVAQPQRKKHYSFYMSQLMLAMIALIVAWDVTALSLALPVSLPAKDEAFPIATDD